MLDSIGVSIWGDNLGRLIWDRSRGISYLQFNDSIRETIKKVIPLYNDYQISESFVIEGIDNPIYHGLPSFIADSLPDTTRLYHQFEHHLSNNYLAFHELSFIGKNGMGALDYESSNSSIKQQSLKMLRFKKVDDSIIICSDQKIGGIIKQIHNPVGGRKHKVFLAIDPESLSIIIGVPEIQNQFDQYILKYEDTEEQGALLEYVYYLIALRSGIKMAESKLVSIDGERHFATKRFDIQKGERVHTQTLAALSPLSNDYESLFSVAKKIGVPDQDYPELFRRMIFNILANNTDDHTKNFTFLMDKKGKWETAPAYDLLFSFVYGTNEPQSKHTLSVNKKHTGIKYTDVLDLANKYCIDKPLEIVNAVVESFNVLPDYLHKYRIKGRDNEIIVETVRHNINTFKQ